MSNPSWPSVTADGRRSVPPAPSLTECIELLDLRPDAAESLPFAPGDVTAGSENELQVAVVGPAASVDLPRTIRASRFYANVIRRAASGDTSRQVVHGIQQYIEENGDEVWENSWVRLPRRTLNPFALRVFHDDLRSDRSNPSSPPRHDAARFRLRENGEDQVRVPMSYLIKLALADAVCPTSRPPAPVRQTGVRLLEHFLSDNTSPETVSFHVSSLEPAAGNGRALARETGRRYLLTQLLVAYANGKFQLAASGQRASVFLSPHPPLRQRYINDCIPDAFYRDLFMSPCLSGWNRGEEKQQYMELCHQVLSRSQLNAVMKLREAGIITKNLVVLPNPSNISLANNGTHISLGSRRLSARLADPGDPYGAAHEKCLGDLVIKIAEHFLPLFVGTYSAAPYRLDFADFHPEVALGFLPHELDYTHLRMLWRRWKKKARNSTFGRPLTPFGPRPVDRFLSTLFRLKGDFVADFRLVDYPVALLSTPTSPALDGRLGNDLRLRKDLNDMGVFDARMSLYLPLKLRAQAVCGFSGFEARYYSLFPSLERDMAAATDLQMLLTLLAWRYIAGQQCTHASIPDDPVVESERRQIIFGAAIGMPTFYVHKRTRNRLLANIVQRAHRVRSSGRYPGYWRIYHAEYRRALLELIRADGADLIELLQLAPQLDDLEQRLEAPREHAACERLTRDILEAAGARTPLQMRAADFNRAAEHHYRLDLRQQHLNEGLDQLARDARTMKIAPDDATRAALASLLDDVDETALIGAARQGLAEDRLAPETARRLIHLLLLAERRDAAAQSPATTPAAQTPEAML